MATKTNTVTTVNAASVNEQSMDVLLGAAHSLPQGSPLAILLENILASLRSGVDVAALSLDRPVTPNQAAAALGMSRPSVYKLMDSGLLKFHYVGKDRRIPATALVDYLDRRERASAQLAEDLANRDRTIKQAVDAIAPLSAEDLAELEEA
ncbi:DNA-binding protein [Actinomyces sp. 432]|uniref:helix-turn-helix domain-containing protein n=1 Tax=unclassified Actinomyces TaxID=2609248 RepID=UPI0013739E7E|nr:MULTISPECIES: helix-turn-helix domain-containing protein [unclassified Actinomyces]MBW3069530.1 helix-turn-helix domain-containing protein [Actinomyces sp. 594]QHO90504.1 DNA-binding protein [Actinomyces sp. 432]